MTQEKKKEETEEAETYYHYTDDAGAKGIAQSGVIKKSTRDRGDAAFGDGTYVTTMPPSRPKRDIIENNYDNRTNRGWVEQQVRAGNSLHLSMSPYSAISCAYTIQPVAQPVVSCKRGFSCRLCVTVQHKQHIQCSLVTVHASSGTFLIQKSTEYRPRLVAWSSGIASVFGRCAFAVLRSTCS